MQARLLDYQKQVVGTVFNVANCGHMKISVTSIFHFSSRTTHTSLYCKFTMYFIIFLTEL